MGVVAMTWSVGLVGVVGHPVRVEVDVSAGLPATTVVGLPDAAVVEARDRIRAAVLNSGHGWPMRRITVSLTPASVRKHGSGFDLALAVAVLAGAGAVPLGGLTDTAFVAELGLDGRVRGVRGVLPAVLAAARAGLRTVVVARDNLREADAVPGVVALGATHLTDVVKMLRGERSAVVSAAEEGPAGAGGQPPVSSGGDLSEVVGQPVGRRAAEVAAAGGHHLMLVGPPGAGKTMLGARIPGLLPDLTDAQALEVTAVHSVAEVLDEASGLVRRPPLQDPHHTATVGAMVGAGSSDLRPGAASLAHHGVLLRDEAPEFPVAVLQALRQPLETGEVVVMRARSRVRFPARFQMVLTANPCPCASPSGDQVCSCPASLRRRYLARLSGPLLDRVDLRVRLGPLTRAALYDGLEFSEPSAVVRHRVAAARAAAGERWRGYGYECNAEVPGSLLRGQGMPPRRALLPLERALDRGDLSVRGFDRVLRVAWTVADLAGVSAPELAHVSEALELRGEVVT